MIVVTSGFVLGICQLQKTQIWGLIHLLPDVQESHHQGARSRVTWGVDIYFSQGLFQILDRAPVSPIHCLGCPPCPTGKGASSQHQAQIPAHCGNGGNPTLVLVPGPSSSLAGDPTVSSLWWFPP